MIVSALCAPNPSGRLWFAVLKDTLWLTKPRLTALVLWTCGSGMYLAGQSLALGTALLLLAAVCGLVASANVWNAIIEVESDKRMERTKHRPLPADRLSRRYAGWVAGSGSLLTLAILLRYGNGLTFALGLLALFSYVCLYTPLKRYSAAALWVGALPGALPPLMGVTAVDGALTPLGCALFALLFVWQIPHFLAIAVYLAEDYRRGGLVVLSHHVSQGTMTWLALIHIVALVPIVHWLGVLQHLGWWWWCFTGALTLAFGWSAWPGFVAKDASWSRRLFAMSLLYMTGILAALLAAGPVRSLQS